MQTLQSRINGVQVDESTSLRLAHQGCSRRKRNGPKSVPRARRSRRPRLVDADERGRQDAEDEVAEGDVVAPRHAPWCSCHGPGV